MLIHEQILRPRLISAKKYHSDLQTKITIVFRPPLLLITKDGIHVAGQAALVMNRA